MPPPQNKYLKNIKEIKNIKNIRNIKNIKVYIKTTGEEYEGRTALFGAAPAEFFYFFLNYRIIYINIIHPKSKNICGFHFSVQNNLRKKCVNSHDKILRQQCVNKRNSIMF